MKTVPENQTRFVFAVVYDCLPSLRASPKSMSLILLPVLLIHMMFSGLRSKWTMPCLWINWTPSMICSMYLITSRSVSSKSSSTIRSNNSPPEILQPVGTTMTLSLSDANQLLSECNFNALELFIDIPFNNQMNSVWSAKQFSYSQGDLILGYFPSCLPSWSREHPCFLLPTSLFLHLTI